MSDLSEISNSVNESRLIEIRSKKDTTIKNLMTPEEKVFLDLLATIFVNKVLGNSEDNQFSQAQLE